MLMDLFIESLTGAAFELRVSPYETVLSVKAKIQRQEGILIGQQHLLWQDRELDDDASLHEAGIPSGGTLRLVLSMRGGPINTRRAPVEPPSWSDEAAGHSIADIMWPGSSNKLVTLLVLREGDQFNFFRVMDRGDGTITPVAEALSADSKRGSREATDEEPNGYSGNDEDSSDESSTSANRRGGAVASGFRSKRHSSGALTSDKLIHRPSSTALRAHETASPQGAFIPPEQHVPSSNSLHLKMRMLQQKMNQMRLNRDSLASDHNRKLAPLLPAASSKESSEVGGGHGQHFSSFSSCTPLNSSPQNASSLAHDRGRGSYTLQRRSQNIVGFKAAATKHNPLSASHSLSGSQKPTIMSPGQARPTPNISCLPSNILSPMPPPSASMNKATLVNTSGNNSSRLLPGRSDHLPPVLLSAARHGNGGISTLVARPQRCFHCHKKTGLANSYQCRCGNNYCSRHRYPETHECPYDYKAEGRKLIEEANPVITASKLPKI